MIKGDIRDVLNDKNLIRLPRQYLPLANGGVCDDRFSEKSRAFGLD